MRARRTFAYWPFLIGTLAIAGVPPLSGFFSKDAILDRAAATGHPWLFATGIAAAALTAFYMFRLVFVTFTGNYRGSAEPRAERVATMELPVAILAFLSVVGGWLVLPGRDMFGSLLAAAFPNATRSQSLSEFNWPVALGTLMIVAAGILTAYLLYVQAPPLRDEIKRRIRGTRELLLNAYYADAVYHRLFEAPAYALAEACARVFDPVAVAGIPRVLAAAATSLGDLARAWETGYLRRYGLTIAVGAALLLYFILFTMRGGAAGTH